MIALENLTGLFAVPNPLGGICVRLSFVLTVGRFGNNASSLSISTFSFFHSVYCIQLSSQRALEQEP